jgi:uncharacterized membrane protein YkgB
MDSVAIGVLRAETIIEQVVTIEDVGKAIVRWGLVLVVAWIGAMKFTAYEAMGISPLVAHSPLLGWTYDFVSIQRFRPYSASSSSASRALWRCVRCRRKPQRSAACSRLVCS